MFFSFGSSQGAIENVENIHELTMFSHFPLALDDSCLLSNAEPSTHGLAYGGTGV
jgi:hypothetical protein